jgi:hypothetical protein
MADLSLLPFVLFALIVCADGKRRKRASVGRNILLLMACIKFINFAAEPAYFRQTANESAAAAGADRTNDLCDLQAPPPVLGEFRESSGGV